MRILLVTETYPPEINGVAMTTYRMVQGLRAKGHWVGLVRPRQNIETNEANTWTVPGLPIPQYPGLRLGLPAWWRLRKIMQQLSLDLVHVVTEGPLGWAAVYAARSCQLPVTSGYHTNFAQYSRYYGLTALMPWVSRWLDALHRRCRVTFVPTLDLAAQLSARGIPGVRVVGRGVDTQLFTAAKRNALLRHAWLGRGGEPAQDTLDVIKINASSNDGLVCLYVGRLAPEKNLGVVERAFAAIAARHPHARMVWVGDGPSLSALRQAHPDHIFAGSRRGEDLAAHYASADIFLFASLSETWGNVLTEAMASGLSVVSYRRAAAEIVLQQAENGFAIEVGDESAFTAAALLLADQAPLRFRIGRAASLSMQAYGWEPIIARFEQGFKEATAC